MWRHDVNSDNLINPLPTYVEKEVPTRGSFVSDYESLLSNQSVVRCPFVKHSANEEGECVVVKNARLDISNWRALLLACITVGTKVREIHVHGCYLSPQHFADLAIVSAKAARPLALTLQHCELDTREELLGPYAEAIASLFQESQGIEYISLRGNRLSDRYLSASIQNITANQRLKAINLSDNQLSDDFARSLLTGLKFSHTLQVLSLAGNSISDSSILKIVVEYQVGAPVSQSDDGTIKALTKSLGDKNKAVKELNKKRKKGGLPDVEEISSIPEFIKTIDGQKLFVNNALRMFDLSEINFNGSALQESITSVLGWQRMSESGTKIVLSPQEEGFLNDTCREWVLLN